MRDAILSRTSAGEKSVGEAGRAHNRPCSYTKGSRANRRVKKIMLPGVDSPGPTVSNGDLSRRGEPFMNAIKTPDVSLRHALSTRLSTLLLTIGLNQYLFLRSRRIKVVCIITFEREGIIWLGFLRLCSLHNYVCNSSRVLSFVY